MLHNGGKDMRYAASRIVISSSAASRIVIFATVLLLTVALSVACLESKAPKETPPPNTVIVSKDGGGQYETIGAALKGVQPGMRILVRSGVYDEALIITKPVEIVADIRGAGEQVILQTLNLSNITMRADRALVRGFVIRHRPGLLGTLYLIFTGKDGSAVDIPQGELALEDCDITSNSGVGIAIHGPTAEGSNPIIRECKIYGGQMSGIFFYQNAHGTIENCDIFGHVNNQEVVIQEGSDPTLQSCKIHDGKAGGVLVVEQSIGTFENCEIYDNRFSGVWIRTGSNPTIRNTKINRNDGVAVLSEQNSAGTISDCDLTGNGRGAWNDLAATQLSRSGNIE